MFFNHVLIKLFLKELKIIMQWIFQSVQGKRFYVCIIHAKCQVFEEVSRFNNAIVTSGKVIDTCWVLEFFKNDAVKITLPLISFSILLPLVLQTLIPSFLKLSEAALEVLFPECLWGVMKSIVTAAANLHPVERQPHKNVILCPNPPYSPHLTPGNFWLFPQIKISMIGQHF